jgi:superfamily II DNA or RNA helicase
MNTNTGFRYYQQEADDAIYEELIINNKCIVKMFCGTGKSKLMRYCRVVQNKKLVVYVVPSLSLLEQFYTDYLQDVVEILRISCEEGSTTDATVITQFLKKKKNKIICVTYQSFETLINSLGDIKIDVCIFDEAHHAVGKTYQPLIFETDVCEKQIFFTATPKNANGVIMYDKDDLETGMCGKLVYDYSYFTGVMEGYLNPFEIRIDFYTEDTNASVYESIARAVLESSNGRVLTFHADVNGDSDTSVLRFVNESAFIVAFNKVLQTEFPEKIGYYKRVKMIGLTAKISMSERKRILSMFDTTPDDELFIISSCQTIGEGIDTKNANMCVFVDPKSSFVAITQNIGRIVRKIFGLDKPNSTILIACRVDKTKYLECDGDKDKCDEVIRQDLNKDGNFNSILNVMSAVKQESEDLFEVCLNYPSTYSPQEIEGNLSKHGYQLEDPVTLVESLEQMLDIEIDLDEEEEESDEEMLSRVAEENNVVIEVHSNSLETPVEYYGKQEEQNESDKEIVRIFKSYDEETEDTVYQPIVKKNGDKRNTDVLEPLRRENRFNVKVHTNPDVKVLWNVLSDLDLSRDICSCIIDCEVVDIWPQRFEELKAFIDENEMTPSQKSHDDYEKKLSYWLSDQQKKYNKNKLNEIKNCLWKQFLEKYNTYRSLINDEKYWIQRLDELQQFLNKNNRRPSEYSNNLEEKQLCSWLSNQITHYKTKTSGMKDETRFNLWIQFLEEYKEYFISIDKIWLQNLEKLKIFININQRRPSQHVTDMNENFIATWFGTQQKHYKNKNAGMKDEERYNLWRQILEEYKQYFITDDENWIKQLEEVKIFINKNNKSPSSTDKNASISRLGRWIIQQKLNYKNKLQGMNNKERYNLFTKFLKEYREYFITDDENWIKQLEEVKIFINKNNKSPSSTDKNASISRLGRWIIQQKLNYKNNDRCLSDKDKRKLWEQFLEEYKEYLFTPDELWCHNFNDLVTFIDENQKRPLKESKNDEEKYLGSWLSNQQTHYKKKTSGMKDKTRYNIWTHFLENYKDYFITDDDIWIQKFKALKNFIDTNKKRPSSKSKHDEEMKIGCWLVNNTKNYKKETEGMKDEDRYNLWTQFLEDYKEYFDYTSTAKEEVQPEKEISTNPKQKKSAKLPTSIIKSTKVETKEEIFVRTKPLISEYHNKFCKMRSDNLSQHFQQSPQDFHEYHRVRDECFKTFEDHDIPSNRVIMELDKIKTKKGGKTVVDMGCGTAKISSHFKDDKRFQFINYDHVAINETVQVCDISQLSLEDDSVDICIMSLALWGSNCEEYIKEAFRVLDSQGTLYIIDSTKRWSDKDELQNIILHQEGNKLKQLIEKNNFNIVTSNIDKWCLFKCTK